jgi:Holliday junction resolvasome RuvABC endonuclease subunit
MRILGLDPSLNSYGWAVFDSEAEKPSERRVISGHEGTLKSTVPVARFIHFRALVWDLLRRFKVDGVGLESPAYDGGPFSETHFGLMMFSLEAIFDYRKDCVMFDPATLKYLVKKGSADKFDMQRFVQLDTMNPDQINADEADAYCAAHSAARFFSLRDGMIEPDELTEHERRVFLERGKKIKRGDKTITKRTAHIFRENSRYFAFSRVPRGSVSLPDKSQISPNLLSWLETDN